MKKLSLVVIVSLIVGIGFSGCTQKENPAYKDFQKSPCACFDKRSKDHVSKS